MIDRAMISRLTTIDEISTFYIVVCDTLRELQHSNERECLRIEDECRTLSVQLQETSRAQALAMHQLKENIANMAASESKRATQESTMLSLQVEVAQLRETIRQRQSYHLGLWPVSGIFLVVAIRNQLLEASILLDRRNTTLNQLQLLSDRTRSEIEITKKTIAKLKADDACCQNEVNECDRKSKDIGQALIRAHNTRSRLAQLQSNYEFLQGDVEFGMKQGSSRGRDQCIEDFRRLALNDALV